MANYNNFNQFAEDLCKGVHNFTSDSTCTVKVALTNSAPSASNSVLADIAEISYTNLSSRTITGVTCEQTSGTVALTANDLLLTASGVVPQFRYIVLYNDDVVGKPLIGWYDNGSAVDLLNSETYKVDFGPLGFATVSFTVPA